MIVVAGCLVGWVLRLLRKSDDNLLEREGNGGRRDPEMSRCDLHETISIRFVY